MEEFLGTISASLISTAPQFQGLKKPALRQMGVDEIDLGQDWISAGNADSTVTIATDHQFVRLDGGVIRAQMVRGARYTSVKVVAGD